MSKQSLTPDEYVGLCLVTKSTRFHQPSNSSSAGMTEGPLTIDVAHAVIGTSTESGESLDVVKKALFYGRPVDYVNLDEEMGDKLWYIAIYCANRGVSIEQLMAQNIAKLQARYPDKFSQYHSLNRDLAAERKVLEGFT